MAYKLEIREKVRTGTLNGFLWKRKKEGFGSRFVDEVEKMIGYITKFPLHFQVRYKDYREAVLKTFPYVVIYQMKGNNYLVCE